MSGKRPPAIRRESTIVEANAPHAERHDYQGGHFEVSSRGVYYVKKPDDKLEQKTFICSELRVIAKTRDPLSKNWGRFLSWHDDDGIEHTLAVPLERLEGDGVDLRKEFASKGLCISQQRHARELLAAYIKHWPVEKRARSVNQSGWHDDRFVTPTETIGAIGDTDDEVIAYQSVHAIEPAMSSSGTTDEWRSSIAKWATGNTRLVFALSVAFAAPLVKFAGSDSGGFHLRGASSSGKSTALRAAASVYGDPRRFMREWRATANGLEAIAAIHNDLVLILDEISQADPREVGITAYLLANGQGKTRAGRDGNARGAHRWRLLFLSAGEESLTSVMLEGGKKAKAGQEIRLADIDVDAGAKMGAFENTHQFASANAMAQEIGDAASKYHGAVGMDWLRLLVKNCPTLEEFIADAIAQFTAEHVPKEASGQVLRVAKRFALVGAAGEIATRYELTGWAEGESMRAAAACFKNWTGNFGGAAGNREERCLLEQVRAFFESNGSSRFQVWGDPERPINNRAGFKKGEQYFVFSDVFAKDICDGYDYRWAQTVLITRGWIACSNDTPPRAKQKVALPGMSGSKRVYVFTNKMDVDGET